MTSLLVDSRGDLTAGAIVKENQVYLEATREAATQIRSEAVTSTGAEVVEIAEFEVALAHLRVPEHV